MNITPRLPQLYCLASFGILVANYYLRSPSNAVVTGSGIAVIATMWLWMLISFLSRPSRRTLTWGLLAAGIGCFAVAASVNFVLQSLKIANPFPGVADIFFVLIYPISGAAIAMLARNSSSGSRTLAETAGSAVLIAAVAGEVFTWPSIWVPITELHISVLAKAVILFYPAGDLILMAIAIAIFMMFHRRLPDRQPGDGGTVNDFEMVLIIAGLVGILTSDTVFNYVSIRWNWDQPSWVNIGWFLWFLFWALAALEPAPSPLPVVPVTSVPRSPGVPPQ